MATNQCDVARPALFAWASAGDSAGLVVPGGVDGEVADEFAGGGVDDSDVQVVDEHKNAGSGVGSADADVVQVAVDAQGRRWRTRRGMGVGLIADVLPVEQIVASMMTEAHQVLSAC